MEKATKNIVGLERFTQFLAMGILFVLPLYVVRFVVGSLAFNLVEILIVFLLSAWLIARKKEIKQLIKNSLIRDTRYFFPALLITGGVAASVAMGGNYRAGIGILKGWFILPILFSIITYDLALGDKKLIQKYFETVFYSGATLSFFGLFFWLSGSLTYDGRLRLLFDSPNQLAMTLAPAFIIGTFQITRKILAGARISKLFLDLSAVLLIGANLYASKSTGALLSLAAVYLVIFCWFGGKRKVRIKMAAAVIFVLLALSLLLSFQSAISSKMSGSRSSLASRIVIWKSALTIARDNPVFGVGPGNFQTKYLEYQKYFPPYLEWSAPQPHNLFLAFWLEAGLIGLVGFILLLFQFFRDNKKAIKNNRLYGMLCFAVVLYFIIHGFVDTTYWKNDSALIFWLVITINYLASKRAEDNS